MSGKTNELVGWVEETSSLYDAREYDAVVSSGEQVTAGLMALTLQEMDVPARSWAGWQVPLKTDSAHAAARIEEIGTDNGCRWGLHDRPAHHVEGAQAGQDRVRGNAGTGVFGREGASNPLGRTGHAVQCALAGSIQFRRQQ
jgi:hypothetical protein